MQRNIILLEVLKKENCWLQKHIKKKNQLKKQILFRKKRK